MAHSEKIISRKLMVVVILLLQLLQQMSVITVKHTGS